MRLFMKKLYPYISSGLTAYFLVNFGFFVWRLTNGELVSSYSDLISYNPISILAAYFFGLHVYKYGYGLWIVGNIILTIIFCLIKTRKEKLFYRITSNLGTNIFLLLLTPAISLFLLVLIGFRTPS